MISTPAAIQFFANAMYLKGLIYYDELQDILDAKNDEDFDVIFEKMFRDEYRPNMKRGEAYVRGIIDGLIYVDDNEYNEQLAKW